MFPKQIEDRQTVVDIYNVDFKMRVCSKCGEKVLLKRTQVGGFWHLSGWSDKNGVKHYGGHCTKCFALLH